MKWEQWYSKQGIGPENMDQDVMLQPATVARQLAFADFCKSVLEPRVICEQFSLRNWVISHQQNLQKNS